MSAQTHPSPSKVSPREPSESDLGFETPLSEINTHLSHLWKDQARTRASMMNFAIYEETPDALLKNSEILSEITKDQACRGILIAATEISDKESPSVRAWVTAHCQLRGGEKSVCSEQLAFLIKSPDTNLVRNTVFANLDSDLPLVLWWRGDFSHRFEERFYSVIDRLLIDSSDWTDPLSQFDILQSAYQESSSRFAVNDLAWSRSYHQRLALASLFENPRLSENLQSLETVTIGHKSGNRIPALMLAAWIISRLRLQPAEACSLTSEGIIFKSVGGSPVQIRFEDTGVAGRTAIKSLDLAGQDWSTSLTRRTESHFIQSHIEVSGQSAESFFPADVRSDAKLISSILSRRGVNRLYFEMIPLLKILLTVPSDPAI